MPLLRSRYMLLKAINQLCPGTTWASASRPSDRDTALANECT